MKRNIITILFILVLSLPLFSYETGKSPGKAAMYSFLIPGGGQYYNESIYKAAFWGSAEVGFFALTLYHNSEVNRFKDKRNKAITTAEWSKYNIKVGDQLDKRNNGIWWFGGTLILSVLDAYVDAALFNFDSEKDKLNLQLRSDYVGLEYKF